MNEALRRELLEMRDEDVRVRNHLEAQERLGHGYDPDMEAVHRRNAMRLRAIIAEHGWPTRELAGSDGAEAAWLIVQHAIAEPDFQRRALPLLERAAARGEIPRWQPAYLVDRVRMFDGWPQLYGTQMAPDEEGRMQVWPIAEQATLDERRRAVGLPPFDQRRSEALREAADGDQRAFRAQMDDWARRVGWRRRILHLTTEAEWAVAQREGAYRAASLATEGFIHCSEPQQVVSVANRRFAGRQDLVLLHIDISKLTSPGRYENLEGGTELFPHIYGPLNLDAVIRVTPFRPSVDGTFDHDLLNAVY